MSLPLDQFPASELPARLAAHTTAVKADTTAPYGAAKTKQTVDTPTSIERLQRECPLERMMQYDCQVVRVADGTGLDLGEAVVNCWEIERRFWRCSNGLTVEATGVPQAWGDGGESRRRSMELVRQRAERQRQKAAERERRRLERELRGLLADN
ncbi:hypothetical protein ABW21_db0201490 [Orbilia brochopaga]|nr:hypothetical protein ABW21_db0201490 [Drechslerella brochopaga]